MERSGIIKLYFSTEDQSNQSYIIIAKINGTPPTGVEPAIPGLGGRCRIHWATEAHEVKLKVNTSRFFKHSMCLDKKNDD